MAETIQVSPQMSELITKIQNASRLFRTDIENMDHACLCMTGGGKSRCAYDLIYEVAFVNSLVAGTCDGTAEKVDNPDGWLRVPNEAQNKDRAISTFNESVDKVTAALAAVPTERLSEVVETPLGPMPLEALANILPGHIMYHSGQLNYIQTIAGDEAFHWG